MTRSDQITREITESGGSLSIRRGADVARLSWSRVSPAMVIAASTEVPEAMRGQGIGEKLLAALIADAVAEEFRIVPLCPFVKARGPRHPDWPEVVAR